MTAQDAARQAQNEAAPSPEEMHHLALLVAVAGVRKNDADQAYALAREKAASRFALARKYGLPQQVVMLPGGIEAGVLALAAGGTTVTVDEDALLLLIAAALPSECEDYVTDEAATDPRTAELLAEHAPDLVERRVKPGALSDERAVKVLSEHAPDLVNLRINRAERERLQAYLEEHDGCVPDPAAGEKKMVRVATVTHRDPTGDFRWTGKEKVGIPRVREALESGRLVITPNGDVAETVAGEVVPPDAIERGDAA